MKTVVIRGMSCGHCVTAVTKALESIEGVRNVSVDLETGKVTFDESRPTSPDELRDAIEKAGYDIE